MMKKHEKRNAWRTLKELEPIQSVWCRLGWHMWTNWELWQGPFDQGDVSNATCYCAKCGMPRVESAFTKTLKR